jgi:hypothetical protein
MLLATFIVACFGYIFLTASSVSAAPDASWSGDDISYQGNTYAPTPADVTLPTDIPSGSSAYQFTDSSKTPNLVYFIFFSAGTDNPKSAKEATYIRYTLNPPNSYINPTDKKTITLTPTEDAAKPKTSDGALASSCTIDGIGWIVCPLMNGISEGMDFIYERIQGFLSVQPITTSVNNPIYRIWVYARDLANIGFIIGFLVIIYSYLVGGGFNGYEIRKILPRLVLAAVLINVSYIICAAAVDLSNIAGHGVNQLFENIRDNALPGSATTANVNWTSVTTWVLAGGAGTAAGAIVLPGVVGGAVGGLWFLLAPFLLGAALLVMVTFIILAARQAIIIILIAIAPLAFAAYILPNTEKWFDKWRDLFFTMLVMFPAFGAVFGGAQLAGEVIIRTATSIEQIILGLGVMVAPLAITPLLLKLGGGVLNRLGGIVNNVNKGAYDRYKNYNRDRLAEHVAKNNARNAQMQATGSLRRRNVMRRAAYRQNYKKYNRNRMREAYEGQANALYDDNDQGLETTRSAIRRQYARATGGAYDPSYKFGSAEVADVKHRTDELHQETEARHDQHWKERFDIQNSHFDNALFDQRVRRLQHADKAKLAEGRLETAWTEMQAGADPFQSAGIRGPTTQRLRMQIDDIADTARSISMESLRKQSAEVVIKQANANRLKMHQDLRNYVGGIGGADAAARIFASAKSEVVRDYLDTVKAMGSVQEAYDLEELISVAHTGVKPQSVGGGKATDAEIDSAIQQIVTVKGNNWAFQKLKDRIADEGVIYKNGKYYEQDGVTEIEDVEVAEGRRTRQQIFVDAAKNSKLAIKNLSGTDRGELETGTFTRKSWGKNGSIIRDLRDQKINANRLGDTDIDELMHMVQVLRDDTARKSLTQEARDSFINTIAAIESDPITKSKIAAREWKMINVVGEYVKQAGDLTLDQKIEIESKTETPIPTNFDPNVPYGFAAKFVKPDATDPQGNPIKREPYGPHGDMTYRGEPTASNATDSDDTGV